MSSNSISSALGNLTAEDWDRLRRLLWKKFGWIDKIMGNPNPDDLLNESVNDLLNDKRHCPEDSLIIKKSLINCLYWIVKSKVSHIKDKLKRQEQQAESVSDEQPSDTFGQTIRSEELDKARDSVTDRLISETEPDLKEQILSLVADDPMLEKIVKHQLENPDSNPRHIAEALRIDIKDLYNANRRLKERLKVLNPTGSNK